MDKISEEIILESKLEQERELKEEKRKQVFFEWRKENFNDLRDEFIEYYEDAWETWTYQAFLDEVD